MNLRVLTKRGRSPLTPENFRNGSRTPQQGVEVEKKWERADYYLPGTGRGDALVQINTTKI